MIAPSANPVILEAAEAAHELRRARRVSRVSPAGSLASTAVDALTARIDALLGDPEHAADIERALDERARTLRTAVVAAQYARRREELDAAASAVTAQAAAAGRPLLTVERAKIAEYTARAAAHDAERTNWLGSRVETQEARDGVLDALGRMRVREAREQLRSGLLETRQMREIIAEATPAINRGEPLLLLGETGGAKTALAEHLSRSVLGAEPEFISGYGDISSAQLVGSHELRNAEGATVSAFVPGPLLRAMTTGRPLILDEVNAMPAEFLKRLNRVLQLRPGDVFPVQEDLGREVQIAQGFVILATANEQTPHRYRGIDRMSAELVNRFGANSYRVHYPDAGLDYAAVPQENLLLAAAAIADAQGSVPLRADELERVCRAAFISQQVFSGSHGDGFVEFVSTEREIDGRPGLEESVLAPRTLVAILQKVVLSAGRISLDHALTRFVEGVMHPEDRRVLGLILRSQGFLGTGAPHSPSDR